MANWFKLFECDLDETRMRYGMSKLPEVWPVWTALLMECCKHKSGIIPWESTEQQLFGFSERLKISIPKVNLAIQTLCEMEYCSIASGQLNVLKWNEKQDDYLHRKSQGYWDKRKASQCLTVNHRDSHIEERRGEEIRGEEKRIDKSTTKPLRALFEKPSKDEMEIHAAKIGLPASEVDRFFNYYESNGWRVGKNPMKSWRAAMVNWKLNYEQRTYQSNGRGAVSRENPRNAGIIRGPTNYGTAKPRLQRQREAERAALDAGATHEEAKVAGQMAIAIKDQPRPEPA